MQKTVLLVEDEAGDRNMYGSILWYNGYNVIAAEDGEAGLRLAREQRPDLILLDLHLPLLNGMELNSQLKHDARTRDIPVIALTARTLKEFGGNAQVLGYVKFLEKPVSPLVVLHEVEQLIGPAIIDQADAPERPKVFRTQHDAQQKEAVIQLSAEKQEVAARLRDEIATVLARWNDLVKEEPWFSLPREHRMSNLPAIVDALVQCALVDPGSAACTRAVVVAGAHHGHNRRRQEIPESLVPIEFHLLRQALWRYVYDTFSPSDATYAISLAMDRSVTLALNAAMWGYYREEVEAHEEWDAALEHLVETTRAEQQRAVS